MPPPQRASGTQAAALWFAQAGNTRGSVPATPRTKRVAGHFPHRAGQPRKSSAGPTRSGCRAISSPTAKQHGVVAAGLLHAHPQFLEDKLGHHERVGVIERANRVLPPDGIAVGGPQDERERVGAVPTRHVSLDREPDHGGKLADRVVTHRADDYDLARLRIARDFAAGNERLGLRGGDAAGGHAFDPLALSQQTRSSPKVSVVPIALPEIARPAKHLKVAEIIAPAF